MYDNYLSLAVIYRVAHKNVEQA